MEKLEKLKQRLEENIKSLHISRIPKRTKEAFIELANEEFEKDYGMTLKFLMDGIINRDVQELMSMISELEQRIVVLETPKEIVEETKKIRMLDGSVRGIGGKQK